MALRYTYYSAATNLYPDKQGINRVTWEDNGSENEKEWTEFTREYFPKDPRNDNGIAVEALLKATPEELELIKSILGIK